MNEQLPMEIERKYLIRRPATALLLAQPDVRVEDILQTYLTCENGFGRRVRKSGTPETGWHYTYTRKKPVSFGAKIELEDVITEAEYLALLREGDPERHTISKVRYAIPYGVQLLEVDLYAFSETLATLEVELPHIDTPVELPDWLHILEDVTGNHAYSNASLARDLAFPE